MTDPRRLGLTTETVMRETPFPPPLAIEIPEGSAPSVAARRGPPLADVAPGGLTADQIAEYQRRLARGFYASPAVVREVARRILESGDI